MRPADWAETRHRALADITLFIGTVEKRAWREGVAQPKSIAQMLPHASEFATYYHELRLTRPGYYRVDQEPPVMEPPMSQEWVKA